MDEGAAQLMRERTADAVWLVHVESGAATDFDALATAAGLEGLSRGWREIDAQRARHLLTAVLHKDIAFGADVMPEHRAAWLADQFLTSCGVHDSRFATNCDGVPDEDWHSWTPLTEHTYDVAVAVIGSEGAAIYCVAEDV